MPGGHDDRDTASSGVVVALPSAGAGAAAAEAAADCLDDMVLNVCLTGALCINER